jgi:DNA processing protein
MIASLHSGAIFMQTAKCSASAERYKVRKISVSDSTYPSLLREALRDRSPALYVKGDCGEGADGYGIYERCLGVVGSRRMTRYGKEMVSHLIRGIVRQGVTIVSGFMYGIDSEAHKVCLEEGGRTIAVMPCGVENVYPGENLDLYNSILSSGGLVMSEYLESLPPHKWCFPRRNRIVAGLCAGVLVIEAGLNSGSLITARLSLKMGRSVLAVPGNVNSPQSQGTLQLIQEGAKVVCSEEDLYEICRLHMEKTAGDARSKVQGRREELARSLGGVDPKYLSVYDSIASGSTCVDDVAEETGYPVSEIGVIVTRLSVAGYVCEEGGRFYVL